MKNFLKIFFALTLLFAGAPLLFAQAESGADNASAQNMETGQQGGDSVIPGEDEEYPLIADFAISGLKRTKESYMRDLLSPYMGQPADEKTLKSIETTLQAQNLFDEIKVSAAPLFDAESNETTVEISFKEKFSILPIPYGYYSDGSFAIGLFLADMNAFGIHDIFSVGGIYSKTNIMGMTAYVHQPRRPGRFGFSGAFFVSDSTSTHTNAEDYVTLKYKAFSLSTSARLLYKISQTMNASFGAGYSFFNPHESPWMRRTNTGSLSASWSVSKSSWNGYFLSSNALTVSGALLFSDNADFNFAQSASLNGSLQVPLASRFRLINGLASFYGNNLYYPNYVGRRAGGVSVLPSNFTTTKIAGIFSGFEGALVKGKYGMLSIYAFYEVAFTQDWDKSLYVGHGPEAGLRVYLAKIAFPAFSMGASYNITNREFQYSFSGGVSF